MREDSPSITAQRVALRRAAHQVLDHPVVFDDPLAVDVLGAELAAVLRSTPGKFETPRSQHIRAFMAARSRYAEDQLEAAIARGATQYVLLGAGLDTYAYRNPAASTALRVFEVDHPITQGWKRQQLGSAGIGIPPSLSFVPVDFEKQTLAAALSEAGFDRHAVTFFSWLGVTPYLTLEATMSTLAFIAAMPPSSAVVFDYAVQRSSLDPLEQMALDGLASRVAKAGEPFQLFLDPRALRSMLGAAGFSQVDDLGPSEIDERYFKGRADGLRVKVGLAHLVHAQV